MTTTVTSRSTTRPSDPRERLLSAACELFYREGIHSVGVEKIVAAGKVTRATFYRHFPSKEDLVVAYLEREDEALRTAFAEAAAQLADAPPETMLEAIIIAIADDVSRGHTRGCPFINASAEYPDDDSAVRRTVAAHRHWFRSALEQAFAATGAPDAAERAGALVLLRDAALVGGYLDGPDTIRDTFIRSARSVAAI